MRKNRKKALLKGDDKEREEKRERKLRTLDLGKNFISLCHLQGLPFSRNIKPNQWWHFYSPRKTLFRHIENQIWPKSFQNMFMHCWVTMYYYTANIVVVLIRQTLVNHHSCLDYGLDISTAQTSLNNELHMINDCNAWRLVALVNWWY